MHVFRERASAITQTHNNNNDIELYLHEYNNTGLQKRGKYDNYSNLVMRVQETFFACTFCFPNTNHGIILRGIVALFCS